MTRKLLRALLPALLAIPVIASAAPKTFVMVPKGVHPYYEPCYEGFQAAAKKYGVKVEKVDPQKFELPLQVKVIEDLIAQQVDGIAISALDDAGPGPGHRRRHQGRHQGHHLRRRREVLRAARVHRHQQRGRRHRPPARRWPSS